MTAMGAPTTLFIMTKHRNLVVCYGAATYLLFLVSFCYAIAFVGGFGVPRTVDHGLPAPTAEAVGVNLTLLALFGVQHSVMARPWFKRWWTKFVPSTVERSTYVLLASLVLLGLYWQWRTLPTVVWDVGHPLLRAGVWALFWLGWATVLAATFMINHFELFGLRQTLAAWRGSAIPETGFRATLLYRLVRHPLMLGFIVAFWAAPTMTVGHLLFATGTTGYILLALQLEERDLVAALGDPYRRYRREVPMLVPGLRRHHGCPVAPPSAQRLSASEPG